MGKDFLRLVFPALVVFLVLGVRPVSAFELGKVTEVVNSASGVVQSVQQVGDIYKPMDPQAEFEMGRDVTAELFKTYPPLEIESDNQYLNLLGTYLAGFARDPRPLQGYSFQLVNSKQPNAFSAPGGFILVSHGMVEFLLNEDELAAVLAHEIAHISLGHGVSAVKTSQLTRTGMQLGKNFLAAEAAKNSAVAAVVSSEITESVGSMVTMLVEKGYSRHQEYEADEEGAMILYRAGYNPHAMLSLLKRLGGEDSGGADLGSLLDGVQRSHPSGEERKARLAEIIDRLGVKPGTTMARSQRMRHETAQLKAGNLRPDTTKFTEAEKMMLYPPYSTGEIGFQ